MRVWPVPTVIRVIVSPAPRGRAWSAIRRTGPRPILKASVPCATPPRAGSRPSSITAAGATDCLSCHRKDRPRNHFQGQCSLCHSTSAWKPAHFTHRFPLNHGGANGVCSTCHPSGTASYTCSACHRPAHMRAEHAEEGIYNIAGRCAACHPTGREGDGYEREYEDGEDHDD